jgi:hypothetical protein
VAQKHPGREREPGVGGQGGDNRGDDAAYEHARAPIAKAASVQAAIPAGRRRWRRAGCIDRRR